jgi:chromosome segregation ATPase
MESNTQLYGIRQRIDTNRASLRQTTDRFSEVITTLESIKNDNMETRARLDESISRIQTIENKPEPLHEDVDAKLNAMLTDFSKENLEPILNDIQDQIESLTIEFNALKARLPQKQSMDTEKPPTTAQGKIQLRGRSTSVSSRY